MKALVTGISGMVGSHLADLLIEKKVEVYGIVRNTTNHRNIEHIEDKINLRIGDIKDYSCVLDYMNQIKPDYVFHLAAMSFVPQSFVASAETLFNNIIGTDNVLKAAPDDAKVVIAGSSEEYGLVLPHEVPIKETNVLRPKSPYGVSKVATDYLGYYYAGLGKPVMRLRCFNTEGPRRHELFVTSSFAKQIVEVEVGKREEIKVGNLEAVRDFTDVRDVAKAYLLAAEKCIPGEIYNVCSGKGYKIADVLQILLGSSYVSEINVKQIPSLMRKSEVPILLGDASKFRKQTSWKPKIPFEETLQNLLEWWRSLIQG